MRYTKNVLMLALRNVLLEAGVNNILNEMVVPFLEATVFEGFFVNLKRKFNGTIAIKRDPSTGYVSFKWTPSEGSQLFIIWSDPDKKIQIYLLRRANKKEVIIKVRDSMLLILNSLEDEYIENDFFNDWRDLLERAVGDSTGKFHLKAFSGFLLEEVVANYKAWATRYAEDLHKRTLGDREHHKIKESEFWGLKIVSEDITPGSKIISRDSNDDRERKPSIIIVGYRVEKGRGYDYRLDSH